MEDFRWQMQERIDRGMNPDEAYYSTRDSYASLSDIMEKYHSSEKNATIMDILCDCTCTCDADCECKIPVEDA